MRRDQARQLQVAVIAKGYDLGPAGADSIWGNLSQAATLAAVEASPRLERPQERAWVLSNPAGFYDALRKASIVGPTISVPEFNGLEADLKALVAEKVPLAHAAYVLATDYHETDGTLQPIREYGRGRGRPYGVPGRNNGQIPYGRGKVQLTWDENYERADHELGLNGALIRNYDLALEMDLSARILVRGSKEGWFTGRKLADDLPEVGPGTLEQFVATRDVINGRDRQDLIAGHAVVFQRALIAGGYVQE